LGAVLFVAVLLAAPHARAQEFKIGFIQIERIMRDAAPAKAAAVRVEQDFKPREVALLKRERELRDERAALERDAATMSQSQRAAREHDLEVRARDLQRAREQFVEAFRARQFEELDRLKERMDQVLTKIAREQKFDLIVQQALYAAPSVDITDAVIKALDQK
jgi:outer membrane protein